MGNRRYIEIEFDLLKTSRTYGADIDLRRKRYETFVPLSEKKLTLNFSGLPINRLVIDDYLSASSTNPVQNRIVTQALNNKANIEDIPVGIPSGGLEGQALRKASDADYDMEWSGQ